MLKRKVIYGMNLILFVFSFFYLCTILCTSAYFLGLDDPLSRMVGWLEVPSCWGGDSGLPECSGGPCICPRWYADMLSCCWWCGHVGQSIEGWLPGGGGWYWYDMAWLQWVGTVDEMVVHNHDMAGAVVLWDVEIHLASDHSMVGTRTMVGCQVYFNTLQHDSLNHIMVMDNHFIHCTYPLEPCHIISVSTSTSRQPTLNRLPYIATSSTAT